MTLTTAAPVVDPTRADEPAAPLLRVADLAVTYRTDRGRREAVAAADVHVEPGEFVAVVGESGSGKSTLVQASLGLLPANGRITRGRVEYSGVDVTRWSDRRLSRVRGSYVGFVPQDPGTALNPTKRVGQQVLEAVVLNEPASRPRTAAERVARAVESLEVAGLADARRVYEQYPHELSGGMRQRVLIAIALAGNPKLVVADEPTSALDVTVQRVILDHLGALRRDLGIGVLLVTHDLGVALDRADRVVVMHEGRVVEEGDAGDVLRAPRDPYTRRLLAAAPTRSSVRLAPTDTSTHTPAPAPEPTIAGSTGPVLSAEGVSRTFHVGHGPTRRTIHAVAGVDLHVHPGRTHAIVGESGAGKSTLARLLVGLGTPDGGRVRVGDATLHDLSRRERREVTATCSSSTRTRTRRSTRGSASNVSWPSRCARSGWARGPRSGTGSWSCWTRWRSTRATCGNGRASSRAGSGSGSRSRGRSPSSRARSCSTSPCPRSTCRCRRRSSSSSSTCKPGSASATCSSRTTSASCGSSATT
ncbi:hypothetical protein Cch01nite_07110 [Cellulomonas chitinilytica]|uniref:ABC transporter domain-containing protein n=1 Tax=Cellulomonas chitinilytica TaxID=398759 RepID=A0A919U0Y8_9CELL|nr:hypothetical protein Cch01nite_07110 [Cellulomonas chitinilytica]